MRPWVELVIPLLVFTKVRGTCRSKVALITRISDFFMRAFDMLFQVRGTGSYILALITRVPLKVVYKNYLDIKNAQS